MALGVVMHISAGSWGRFVATTTAAVVVAAAAQLTNCFSIYLFKSLICGVIEDSDRPTDCLTD
jgi:hypothetical protein